MAVAMLDRPLALEPGQRVAVAAAPAPDASALCQPWLRRLTWQDDAASWRHRAVRQCRDLVAALHGHREPVDGESWQAPFDAELRLLAQVNAIVGLGDDAVRLALQDVPDPDLPEPGLVFAALFILGCIRGDAWTSELHRLYRRTLQRTPRERAAATEALCLAPTEAGNGVAASALDAQAPQVRASAVRVLAHRGALDQRRWHRALRDEDPTVRAAAAAAPLRGFDPDEARATLAQAAAQDGEFVMRHVLRSAATLCSPQARSVLLRIVEQSPAWGDAARSLALYGWPGDLQCLQQAALKHPCAATFAALGDMGCVDAMPWLVRVIDDAAVERSHRAAARAAAHDIGGLQLPLESDAHGNAANVWATHAHEFSREQRWRCGRPHNAATLAQLLRSGPPDRVARQQLYRELATATQWQAPRFSAFDFIAEQRAALAQIDAWLAQRSSSGR